MKLGIVIYSNDPETVWNAFRVGVFSLAQQDHVKVFLLGKGVESEMLDTDEFQVVNEMRKFSDAGGIIHFCSVCIRIRLSDDFEMYPASSMSDLYEIIAESDKILTF